MAAAPVLIVDDNEANLKVARFALEAGGYEVRVALNGEAALETLRSFQPRLVLMDIQLPGIDGLELTRRLKADPATRDIVIVAVTAYAMKGDREKALAAGCDGYIAKPLDPIALPDQIGEYLGQATLGPATPTPDIVQPPSPVPSTAAAAGDKAPILLVEDNPTTRKMFRVALESAGHRVTEAHDARMALDAIGRIKPALIIQDLILPDMDGLDLAGELRQRLGSGVPILCVSGFLSRLDQARAMQDGFAQVFVKPVDPLHLVDAVRLHLAELPMGAAGHGTGQRLLVVDDDPLQCKLVKTWLSSAGFDVLTATSGPAALELLRREHPAAVVSDVLMPGMDGFALCLAVRRDMRGSDVPVVLISSSYVEEADRHLAERVGASALLAKTEGIDAVIRAVSAALGGPPPGIPLEPMESVRQEHVQRTLWQLERQVQQNARLQQRCALQEAQLTVLAGVAAALAKHRSLDEALGDVLAACLDMAGITKGALYLAQADGRLALAQQTGFSEAETPHLRASFGCEALLSDLAREGKVILFPSRAVPADAARQITVQAGVASLLLVPVAWEHTTFGALLLGARTADFAGDDALAFARVLGAQMGQTLGLAHSFSRLRASEERYEAIFESAMDAIITIDAEQRIVMFNPAAELMFGHRAGSMTGQPLEQLLPQRHRARHAEHVRHFGATGVTGRRMGALGSLAGLRANGEEFPIEASISQMEADGGRLYTVIVRDITERVRAEQELKAFADTLERRVDERTHELTAARDAANAASRAKSQFLANMSHELRTPLNAVLVLAQLLSENSQGNLDARQVRFAHLIQRSGSDLLLLINDLLDLAKIEAGRVTVDIEEVRFKALQESVEHLLGPLAQEKGLAFSVELAPDLPMALYTDAVRLQQVLRNLLANAIKFTPAGRVALRMRTAGAGWTPRHRVLAQAHTVVAFEVSDTGVGIAPDKQQLIFEAFEQADSSATRKYGGTGLGLAISREIARLLGGEITLRSQPGQGSTFTLYLPLGYAGAVDDATPTSGRSATPVLALVDDREHIVPGDTVVLVIEDDSAFARTLVDLIHAKGMKALVAGTGAKAFALAQQYTPAAITLDLILPDVDGWTVYERLRSDAATAGTPVLVISARDDVRKALALGAVAALVKPAVRPTLEQALETLGAAIRRPLRRLLLVEDDAVERSTIVQMLQGSDVAITEADTGRAALAALRSQRFDCMVLDPMLPDVSGLDVLEALQSDEALHELPVVVHTNGELSEAHKTRLQQAAPRVTISEGRSFEHLLEQTGRFLHRSPERLAQALQQLGRHRHEDRPLAGHKVLLVEDDVRNLFALAALLEHHGLTVATAGSGREALERLPQHPDTAAVLMDMMMPEMDGYEATARLRAMKGCETLPVIALTAKAMKGDREKCLAAGCSDYLSKPVDVGQLLAVLRDWIKH